MNDLRGTESEELDVDDPRLEGILAFVVWAQSDNLQTLDQNAILETGTVHYLCIFLIRENHPDDFSFFLFLSFLFHTMSIYIYLFIYIY